MGFLDAMQQTMQQKFNENAKTELEKILPEGENVIKIYSVKEDFCAITDKRVVFVDKKTSPLLNGCSSFSPLNAGNSNTNTMKTKPTLPHFAVSLLILIFFAGCSSQPAVSDGRAFYESRAGFDGGYAKLVGFKKTDGQGGAHFGVQFYNMSYEATYECTSTEEGCLREGGRTYKKGERFTTTGTIEFEKSEKGWRAKTMD